MNSHELSDFIRLLEVDRRLSQERHDKLGEQIATSTNEDERRKLMKYRSFIFSRLTNTEKALSAARLMDKAHNDAISYYAANFK